MTFLLTGVSNDDVDCVKVCKNGIKNVFHIGTKQWKKLTHDATLPDAKDTTNYKENVNADGGVSEDIIDYLTELGEEEGESHATGFVRT